MESLSKMPDEMKFLFHPLTNGAQLLDMVEWVWHRYTRLTGADQQTAITTNHEQLTEYNLLNQPVTFIEVSVV